MIGVGPRVRFFGVGASHARLLASRSRPDPKTGMLGVTPMVVFRVVDPRNRIYAFGDPLKSVYIYIYIYARSERPLKTIYDKNKQRVRVTLLSDIKKTKKIIDKKVHAKKVSRNSHIKKNDGKS